MSKTVIPTLNNQTMKDVIDLIQKETLRISAYWDLRDDINNFWGYVEKAKEIEIDKFD